MRRKAFRRIDGGEQDEIMHLPHLAALLVYAADLAGNDKARRGEIAQMLYRMLELANLL